MAGFEMSADGVHSVAGLVRDGSEGAARAGIALARLGDRLTPAPPVGRRLVTAVDALSAEWTTVIDDLVAGLAQLATWMDGAVTTMAAVDDDAAGVFRGIPR